MPDTRRSLTALQALLADNTAGDISAQDIRDLLASAHPTHFSRIGAVAGLPPTGNVEGDLYLASDGAHIYRYGAGGDAATPTLLASHKSLALSTTTATSQAITSTGAALLVATVHYSAFSGSLGTHSDTYGNTWVPLTAYVQSGNTAVVIYYCLNPTTGTGHTFTINSAASASIYPSVTLAAYGGGTYAFDAQNGATTASASALNSGSVTPAGAATLFISAVTLQATSAHAASGFTVYQNPDFVTSTAMEGVAASYYTTSTAAAAAAWTWTTASPAAAALAAFTFTPSALTWVPWGPVFPMTPIVDADFAWVNQGSATKNAAGGAVFLSGYVGGNWRARFKAAPATPYTVTVWLRPVLFASGSAAGIGFRASGSDHQRWLFVDLNGASPRLMAEVYTPAYAGTILNSNHIAQGLYCLRISDDGTDRKYWISPDGINFVVVATEARTTGAVADQIGFGVLNAGASFLSWKQG
jgi:hypothetical protein